MCLICEGDLKEARNRRCSGLGKYLSGWRRHGSLPVCLGVEPWQEGESGSLPTSEVTEEGETTSVQARSYCDFWNKLLFHRLQISRRRCNLIQPAHSCEPLDTAKHSSLSRALDSSSPPFRFLTSPRYTRMLWGSDTTMGGNRRQTR